MVVPKPFVFVFCLLTFVCSGFLQVNAQDEKAAQEPKQDAVDAQKETEQVEDEAAVRVSSENFLPATTRFWLSVPDVLTLQTKFGETDFGRLTHDSDMQPFIEAMTSQIRDWANAKNVRLGLTVDDVSGLESGEICVAGILPIDADGVPMGRGSHGLVFLVDVSDCEDEARELMKKIGKKMDDRGAEKVEMESINGTDVFNWRWEKENPKTGKKRTYTTIHTLTDGWLIASDNETVFRDVIRRIKNPGLDKLSSHPTFVEIQKATKIENVTPQVRWYIDPFGYMKLADAIAKEEQIFRKKNNNIGEVLESQGFDAIKGFGGNLSFAANKKDVVYRAFVYTPPRSVGKAQERARGILDFENAWDYELKPEPWVGNDVAAYSTFTWNAERAFTNVGEVFDAFVDPEVEGDWDNIVNGVSNDMGIDLRKMVGRLDNRFSVMSATEKPIGPRSERVVIGVKINGDVDEFFEMTRKLLPEGEDLTVNGHELLLVDTADDETGDLQIQEESDPVFGPEGGSDEDEGEEVELFNLFEKRYFAVVPASQVEKGDGEKDGDEEGAEGKVEGGYLLVANNEEYLVKVIEAALEGKQSELGQADDFNHVNAVLNELIDPSSVSVRQFGRMDRILEANYEMMRKGNMAESQTVLARVLNHVFKDPDADPDAVREQQIDGSKLPADYSESVAPFFGPGGWAMETKKDGWRITGVVLKKKANEVVRKTDEEKSRR